jgi:RNA polymerase sigma-54 factor
MVEQGLFQSQTLRQEQTLAPQQIQSLEILLAPLLELQAKINMELETNPTLEQETPGNEELSGDLIADAESAVMAVSESEKKELDDGGISELIQLSEVWHDFLPVGPLQSFSPEDEKKRQHFFDSLVNEVSLQEHLMEQLKHLNLSKEERERAELIIGSVDNTGYLRSILEDLATIAEVDVKEMEKALKLVQSFDPPGIAARDLKECLLLQLKRAGNKDFILERLIEEHLDDIAANKLPLVAKKMNISMEELHSYINKIKRLNPYPGTALAPDNPVYIVPEVKIEKVDGKFVVIPNDESIPKLRVSQFYLKLLENPATSKETKEYIKEKLLKSKSLIKSIVQRQKTIVKIAEVILECQYEFFEKGIEALKPLTMQYVADKLNLHETTISRAIANKYMLTPFGLFEFKFFFSSGFQSDSGEDVSSRSVKEKIKDLIARENPAKPISDSKIAKLLKEQGLSVARRTVAKYREDMGIPSSHLRREFS